MNRSRVEQLPERLAGYEVLVLMRERTRFDADTLAQLPRLQLVVTTGMRNASLDVAYLQRAWCHRVRYWHGSEL